MKKYIFFITSCLLMFFSLYGQDFDIKKRRDSILHYIKISQEYINQSKFKECVEAAGKGLKLARDPYDPYNLSELYYLIGYGYESVGDYQKALYNYNKALEFSYISHNERLRGWAYNNIGNLYTERFKKIDSGLIFYKKSLAIAVGMKDTVGMLSPTMNIGWTYMDEREYDKAYPFLIRSKTINDTEYGDDRGIAQINYLLGRYKVQKRDYESAELHFRKAIRYGKQEKLWQELTETYEHYAKLAIMQNDYKLAFELQKNQIFYKNLRYDETRIEETQKAYVKYELDEYKRNLELSEKEKESQGLILKQSKQILYVVIAAGFILLLLLINMFKNYKFRNKALAKLRLKNKELRDAKEQAEHYANIKSQFFSTVSHELRTPLYGVIGLTSLLEEDVSELRENENFRSLKFSSKYLLSLINNVLQINKIESNGVTLEMIPFNIRSLVNEVVNSFSFAVQQNENKVHQEIDSSIPETLLGDSVRLSQILMNLIGNAVKFTELGNIWITLTLLESNEKKHKIQFSIKDDGVGIPKEKQATIFDKFVQVKRGEKNYQGTGLGLSIVKHLLTLFDSNISMKSVVNEGSEFVFVIEFEESKKIQENHNQVVTNPAENINKRILIVEDNKINQVVTKRILSRKGFMCHIASDGLEALEKIKEINYDLILMDINMPKMDGIETCKHIRSQEIITPIIALTAVEEEKIKDKILDVGMNDFIIKPYDVQKFHQVILRNLYKDIK